jgi:hypothetical protein
MNNNTRTFKRSFHSTNSRNIDSIGPLLVIYDLAQLMDIGDLVSYTKQIIENGYQGNMYTTRLVDFFNTPNPNGMTPAENWNVNTEA